MNAGDEARGIARVELDSRDWKRLSNGRKEGVGLSRPGLVATEGNMLLPPGEDSTEPCGDFSSIRQYRSSYLPEQMVNHQVLSQQDSPRDE